MTLCTFREENMKTLTVTQMAAVQGGSLDANEVCGIAVGATVMATALFGGVGFALTINKAIAACTIAVLT